MKAAAFQTSSLHSVIASTSVSNESRKLSTQKLVLTRGAAVGNLSFRSAADALGLEGLIFGTDLDLVKESLDVS